MSLIARSPVIPALCLGSLVPAAFAQVSPFTGQNAPAVVCFAEGTDPDYAAAMSTIVTTQNQVFVGPTDYYQANQRWPGAQGTPRALTWSFVPDGTVITAAVGGETNSGSTLFAQMDGAFASQGGRAAWMNRFQQIFDRWSQVSGVTFTRVRAGSAEWDDGAAWGTAGAAGARGEIRISMHNIDGGSNILAYAYYPTSGDMVLDGSDIGFFAGSANANLNLRDVVEHEIGHALGLAHVCSAGSDQLMEPYINTSFDGPRQDDIRGMQRWYGDPMEPNDSAASATALGTLSPGNAQERGAIQAPLTGSNDPNSALLSIDAAGKSDWFAFSAAAPLSVTVTATPVGSTYDDSAQAGDGSCPSNSTVNAAGVADLVVDLFAGNGSDLVAGGNRSGAGAAELLSGVALGAGTYYVRVTAAGTPAQAQLYRLSVTGGAAPSCYANCDGSAAAPVLNVADFTCFLQKYAGGDAYANCDGSVAAPVLNVADFTCFLQKYSTGCP